MRLQTPEDWWSVIDFHLSNLQQTADRVYIDPPVASLRSSLAEAVQQRDHVKAHDILEAIWTAAPDRPYIHRWPSWGVLCDLCSEYSVCFHSEDVPDES